MQALEGEKIDNPLVVSLLEKLSKLCRRADIVFCWLPSHIGIGGNEEADKAAKDALSLEILPFKVPSNDFKPLIHTFIQNVWQQSWNDPANQNNKLFAIKPGLGEWLSGIADKSPRRNYLGPSSHWSFIYYALLSSERRRRASVYTLQCTFNY